MLSSPRQHEVVNELADNVVLHSVSRADPTEFVFHIDNLSDEILHFTFDFSKSVNLKIEDADHPLLISVSMKPHTQSIKVKLVTIDPSQPYEIALSTGWEYEEHDELTNDDYKSKWDNTIEFLVAEHTPKVELPTECRSRDELKHLLGEHEFVDKSFPPKNSSLYQIGRKGNRPSVKTLAFRRPSQFSTLPTVFGDKITPEDVILGSLPDVWLISTLANLADFPPLITSLFPEGFRSTSDSGIYKVNLFQCGVKTSVILDDFFPCYLNAGPAYSRTKSNALWVLLIEKAFAKLYGGYSAISSGTPYEALIDLLGAPTKCIRFDDADTKLSIRNGSLFQLLRDYEAQGYLMTVSSGLDTEEAIGLIAGHSFTVLKLAETSSGQKLIKLHNPWVLLNWEGDWSHSSPMWTPKIRSEVGANDYPETVLWMSFEDCVTRLHCVNVCFARKDKNGVVPYKERRERFDFSFNPSTGSVENSLFLVKPLRNATVYFTVHQRDAHILGEKPHIDLGVSVLRRHVSLLAVCCIELVLMSLGWLTRTRACCWWEPRGTALSGRT